MRPYWKFALPATIAVVALVLIGANLASSLVYFNTPTELTDQASDDGRLRLGGQVVEGTVVDTGDGVTFAVTDGRTEVSVLHTGAPQQLFQEGIGVVVEGTWDGDAFHSDTMLVKHDETYGTEDGTYDPEHPYGADPGGS